jgi:predicted nucleic acid-binding protein
VIEVVLDASVVLKWFQPGDQPNAAAARSIRADYEQGEILVRAPFLLHLEIVNVAGRRWGWNRAALKGLVTSLERLGFELVDPELGRVAAWTARDLTAYDAAYVAVAEAAAVKLVTDDALILRVAAELTDPLSGYGQSDHRSAAM